MNAPGKYVHMLLSAVSSISSMMLVWGCLYDKKWPSMAPVLEICGYIDIFHWLLSSSEHQFQSVLPIVLCSIYTHERTGSTNRPWLIRHTPTFVSGGQSCLHCIWSSARNEFRLTVHLTSLPFIAFTQDANALIHMYIFNYVTSGLLFFTLLTLKLKVCLYSKPYTICCISATS